MLLGLLHFATHHPSTKQGWTILGAWVADVALAVFAWRITRTCNARHRPTRR